MLVMILIFAVLFLIVAAAIRIILGWILPKQTVAKVDRFVSAAVNLYFKLCIVALGIGIIAFFVYVFRYSP